MPNMPQMPTMQAVRNLKIAVWLQSRLHGEEKGEEDGADVDGMSVMVATVVEPSCLIHVMNISF